MKSILAIVGEDLESDNTLSGGAPCLTLMGINSDDYRVESDSEAIE